MAERALRIRLEDALGRTIYDGTVQWGTPTRERTGHPDIVIYQGRVWRPAGIDGRPPYTEESPVVTYLEMQQVLWLPEQSRASHA